MKKIPQFILALILFSCHLSQGQMHPGYSKGYIIKANDTLRGTVRSVRPKIFQRTCLFKVDGTNSFREYNPSEIEGFFASDLGWFESRQNLPLESREKQDYFLQVLEKGHATLYLLIDQANGRHYFIEKDTIFRELVKRFRMERNEAGAIIKRTSNLYKGTLQSCFHECPQPDEVNFFQSSLQKAVFNYNRCIDPNHQRSARGRGNMSLGFTAGIIQNTLEMKNLENLLVVNIHESGITAADISDYSKVYVYSSFTWGIAFEVPFGKNKHFSFQSNLLFSSRNFESDKLYIDYTNVDVPLLLKYTGLLRSPVRPFMDLGILVPFNLRSNIRSKAIPLRQYSNDGVAGEIIHHIEPLATSRFVPSQMHIVAGLGIEISVSSRSKAQTQLRFDSTNMSRSSSIDLDLKSTAMIVGYLYRINN